MYKPIEYGHENDPELTFPLAKTGAISTPLYAAKPTPLSKFFHRGARRQDSQDERMD
jgi:hypothetical protein